MISDDLVNSYHLLLCALDLVYGNALQCSNRKELVNPNFKGKLVHRTLGQPTCLHRVPSGELVHSAGAQPGLPLRSLVHYTPPAPPLCGSVPRRPVGRFPRQGLQAFLRPALRHRETLLLARRPGSGGQGDKGALLEALHQKALREEGW